MALLLAGAGPNRRSSAYKAQFNDRGTSASMTIYAIQLHQLSLMVALRRSPSVCAGSPFGSLHTVIGRH